jgi:hypothetical protein
MTWKRRQPTWPYVVTVACLFALTLAAPAWWHRHQRSQATADAPQTAGIPRSASTIVHPWPVPASAPQLAPALPPLAAGAPGLDDPMPTSGEPQIAAPSLAGPVVESNDYVVVDEPLVEPTATLDADMPMPDDEGPAFDAPPSAVAESFAARPGGRSVVVRSVTSPAAPATPTRPAIAIESLVRVRDGLMTLLGEAQRRAQQIAASQAAPSTAAPGPASPMRVVVESENDRLAMIPEFAASDPRIAIAPTPGSGPSPDLAPAPVPELTAEPLNSRGPTPPPAALRHPPIALIRELEAIPSDAPGASWAAAVLARLEQLANQPAPPAGEVETLLADLRSLSTDGFSDAVRVADPAAQSGWIRADRALDRRLPVWELLLDQRAVAQVESQPATAHVDAILLQSLHEVAALTAGTQEGAAWRNYLRLDDLAGLTSVGGIDYAESRRATARDVLIRMADPWLTPEQVAFLAQPPLTALALDLRPWASGPVSLDALAALVEDYEFSGSLGDAEAIAEQRQRMKWSSDSRLEALAADLNRNYRNANVRVALSAELFNRLVPPQEPVNAPVNERIAGAEVHGRSHTETQVHVRLLPDPKVWRIGLEATGVVQSRTYSDAGPARILSASRMEYEARKLLVINRFGMHIWPTEAKVEGRNSLAGVESRLDGVPVVGSILEDVVRKKYRESQGAAVAQVKSKVKRQACTRMDAEADAKLHEFEGRITENVLSRLERFALTAEPMDMSTTEERAVMRLRMAGEQHLGAHTPRPSAPSDSLASLQLHESAINNAVRGLELDGRRITVGELHELLRTKFSARPETPVSDVPQKAIVEFAAHDAVRIACHGDCVELMLSIVELRKGRDSIRDVVVHAFFTPVVDGLEVKLVRDGNLQFEGAHLRSGPRLVLHSVFGNILRKDQEIPVLAARLSDDPRLAGLMVTQLVIEDGWVALSVGPATPERTAWRTRGAVTR